MKKLLNIILSFVMILSLSTTAFAIEPVSLYVNESDITVVPDSALTGMETNSSNRNISPRFVNECLSRKVDVKTDNEWSPYKRVSDNLATGRAGGSITANKTATFGTTVSGSILGIGISTNASVSSSSNYTLHVAANTTAYIGYRVYYTVETGVREYYDMGTNKVISRNNYTVKTPKYGEYTLILVK